MMEGIEWNAFDLPNIQLYSTKLKPEVMDYLWDRIEQAKIADQNCNKHLAGNITKSLTLEDKSSTLGDNYFLNAIIGPLTQEFRSSVMSADKRWELPLKNETQLGLGLSWWVNFQNQTEFNPSHRHSGILSFVIFMKIPTDWREQHELPFSSHSAGPAASDFCFAYSNILGETGEYPIFLDKDMQGTMIVFPSTLRHQVYPYYNCDDERITISGNMLWDVL
tara:strand:+ start:689 stop:1351 length:663 start_codon:yes stop_codon:yes gene_type:complete